MNPHRRFHRMQGLGMIELMIALSISALLILGLVQLFSGTRIAYQSNEGLARVQENGRFAMDFLQRDLRMAGHMGCVADAAHYRSNDDSVRANPAPTAVPRPPPDVHSHFIPLANRQNGETTPAPYAVRMDLAVEGYEAIGTGTTATLILPATPVVSGNAAAWNPALPAVIASRAIAGSDVVMVRFLSSDAVPVDAVNQAAVPPTIVVPPANRNYVNLTEGSGVYALTDCLKASVFQNTTAADAAGAFQVLQLGPNVSGFVGQEGYIAAASTLHRVESYAYFVGVGTGGGPSLFRLRFDRAFAPQPEELIEGVENLQLLYGRDTTNPAVPDGAMDVYETAAEVSAVAALQVPNWHRVGSIRVGLLMRSTEPAGIPAQGNYRLLGLTLTPPNDTRLRSTYVNSIALRNRLFGN